TNSQENAMRTPPVADKRWPYHFDHGQERPPGRWPTQWCKGCTVVHPVRPGGTLVPRRPAEDSTQGVHLRVTPAPARLHTVTLKKPGPSLPYHRAGPGRGDQR